MNVVLADCEEFRKVKAKGGKVKAGQPEQEDKRLSSISLSISLLSFFLSSFFFLLFFSLLSFNVWVSCGQVVLMMSKRGVDCDPRFGNSCQDGSQRLSRALCSELGPLGWFC